MLLTEQDNAGLGALGRRRGGFKKLLKKANPIARIKQTVQIVKKAHRVHMAKSPLMKLHKKHMEKSPLIKAIKKNPNIAIMAASFIPVVGTAAAAAGKLALMVKQKRDAAAAARSADEQARLEQEAMAAEAAQQIVEAAPPEYEADAVGAAIFNPETKLKVALPVPERGGFIPGPIRGPIKPGPGRGPVIREPAGPKLSPEEARQKFGEWLAVEMPAVAERIEAENPALLGELINLGGFDDSGEWDGGIGQDEGGFFSDWASTISDIAQKVVPVARDYLTMRVQVQRAKEGKPPLPTQQAQAVAAAQVAPRQAAPAVSMPLMLGIAGLGALAFMAMRRR